LGYRELSGKWLKKQMLAAVKDRRTLYEILHIGGWKRHRGSET
jgi:hypothetical protein